MDAKLVALRRHAALLVLVEERRDRRNEEGRLGVMFCKRIENARHALAVAVLALRHAADGFAAVAQFVRLMIRIERESHRATRSVLPSLPASSSVRRGRDRPCRARCLPPGPGLAAAVSSKAMLLSMYQNASFSPCDNYERPPSTEMIWPEIQPAASDAETSRRPRYPVAGRACAYECSRAGAAVPPRRNSPIVAGSRDSTKRSRRDAVDGDAERSELEAELLGQPDERVLRGRVGLNARQARPQSGARRDIDDPPEAVRLHVPARRPASNRTRRARWPRTTRANPVRSPPRGVGRPGRGRRLRN